MKKLYNQMMDLHNHTNLSDGEDTVEEIIKNAIDYEIEIIGITDHYHQIDDIDIYFRIIEYFQKKYSKKIKILKGIEIDIARLSEPIDLNIIERSDYILIENLEYIANFDKGIQLIKELIDRYNGIVGLAHINFERFIQRFGKNEFLNLLAFMGANELCWEINSNFENGFYDRLLYNRSEEIDYIIDTISKYNVSVIAGSDTHSLYYFNFKRLSDVNNF